MNEALTAALTPLSGLYSVAVRARRRLYDYGILRVHRLPAPVISVGNITLGGTGKTPLVEFVAQQLAGMGRHVCILTRGYGRVKPDDQVMVSDGNNVMSDPLLAERLKGRAAVICNIDRVAAGNWAIEKLKSDVFVLDDAFQNLRLARDLNIVTIDATNPWGNNRLLPAGILREPRAAISRAGCLVMTRANEGNQVQRLRHELVELNGSAHLFQSSMHLSGLRELTDSKRQAASIADAESKPVAAFCGIGNPESFFSLLRNNGYQLCHTQTFRDHFAYQQKDLDQVTRTAVAHGAKALLTTAKDEVKLRSFNCNLPCLSADIKIEIEESEAFANMLKEAVSSWQLRHSRLTHPAESASAS
jgi:tetraacyldisaccharide 4'-kinase